MPWGPVGRAVGTAEGKARLEEILTVKEAAPMGHVCALHKGLRSPLIPFRYGRTSSGRERMEVGKEKRKNKQTKNPNQNNKKNTKTRSPHTAERSSPSSRSLSPSPPSTDHGRLDPITASSRQHCRQRSIAAAGTAATRASRCRRAAAGRAEP